MALTAYLECSLDPFNVELFPEVLAGTGILGGWGKWGGGGGKGGTIPNATLSPPEISLL